MSTAERMRRFRAAHPGYGAEWARKWRLANPGMQAARHRKSAYGLSQESFDALYIKQAGLCAICKRPPGRLKGARGGADTLAVDHSHVTGLTRGLLCRTCNSGIGLFGDDIAVLTQAIEYLKGAAQENHGITTASL